MFQFFCIICTAFFVQFQPLAKEYDVTDFILNGQEAQNINQNLIWLRCSAGQRWTVDETCSGQPMLLTYDEAVLASDIASEQLSGNWRLPTRSELEEIVCDSCGPPKINHIIFPNTPSGTFWSNKKKKKKFYWIVSFFNGNSFGVGFRTQKRYVRLVRQ